MTEALMDEIRPWDRPFWQPAPGKSAVLIYLILIHALAIAALIFFPIPSWKVVAVAVGFTALGGFGTTVCYHRLLAHRTFKVNKFIEHFLIFWAMFNGSGAPASWCAYHRHHHSRADTPEDISSPKHGGFWWAHLRWLYQCPRADVKKWAPELTVGTYRFWGYAEGPVIVLSILCGGLLFGWQGLLWLGGVRMVYSLHMQCLVNSLTHLGHAENGDTSQNVWWLGPLQLTAWGENWHANHHHNAGSAKFGLRWWQPDIGWYFIYALEAVGLAHGVKRPSRVH